MPAAMASSTLMSGAANSVPPARESTAAISEHHPNGAAEMERLLTLVTEGLAPRGTGG
ncbi:MULTISPECIES: hypothetical protein [unclassified Streptomyces]|uniref:hypothetical protein n=1 Tax=unclassified Streptomyces TaxID=2593676 RepID=UPI003369DE91